MDFGLFFSTILGSAGVFSLIQFFVTRHDHRKDDLDEIKKELASIKKIQDEILAKDNFNPQILSPNALIL